ncbi:MAG: sigma 54-interacting transcriptional regulator [Planctomycetaceae bacterium]
MFSLTVQKSSLAAAAGAAVVYSVFLLAYVATMPDVRLQALLTNSDRVPPGQGVEVQETDGLGSCFGMTPTKGDVVHQLAGRNIRSFTDFASTVAELRTRPLRPGESLTAGSDPTEAPAGSTSTFVQIENEGRFAKVLFSRQGETRMLKGWVPLEPQPLGRLSLSLTWFVLQLGITLLVGLAYWQRPYDSSLRKFWIISILSLVGFLGGNHWWVIAGNLFFLIPFVTCGTILPAVLLDFFLTFPKPRLAVLRFPRIAVALLYAPAVVVVALLWVMIWTGGWMSSDHGSGPLSHLLERLGAYRTATLLPSIRTLVSCAVGLSGVYFGLSVASLVHAYANTRRVHEHEQLRWILWAGLLAIVPISYVMWLAVWNRVEFSFGGAQLPLFIASMLFMLSYVVGIVRHRLLLIDQTLNRGLLYYAVSVGTTLLFSMAVALGTVSTLHQGLSLFGQPILLYLVLSLSVMLLVWLRDRVQRGVDREFFREKYRLDKSLRGLNQAVAGLLDRKSMADRMLASCQEVLQCSRAAVYLKDPNSREFQRLAERRGVGVADDAPEFPPKIEASRELMLAISSGMALQRVRSGTTPVQQVMRAIDSELISGLDVDGTLAGVVVLGTKLSGTGYSAEDVTYLTALGRVAGVSLHFGKVHEDLTHMNVEFARLNDEIVRRQEEVLRVEEELRQVKESERRQQREIESLEQQLSIPRPSKEGTRPTTAATNSTGLIAPAIKGTGPAMLTVLETVRKVAGSASSVLIRGESGTGKELLARALHENSPRRDMPLISVHCAALAPGVLESELFGHVKGAFTDARNDKRGRFQLADGGTLFLDEIGDVPLETQIKLLRALQERTIEPVGGTEPVPVDVRLIAATHQNLEQLITEGRFREDLYYRLNVISIPLPPLRDRGNDIVELAVHFLRRATERSQKEISHFDERVLDCFLKYHWPGNIRELENAVERAVVLAEKDRITLDDLPLSLKNHRVPQRRATDNSPLLGRSAVQGINTPQRGVVPQASSYAPVAPVIGSDEERMMLEEALAKCQGNKTQAAALLGLPRSTYFSKLKKHGIN